MKKNLAFILILLSGSSLFAQKSTYLKAETGFGRSTARSSVGSQRVGSWQPISSSRFAVTGGVQVKKLSVEIGFGYGRAGGRSTDVIRQSLTSIPTTIKATHRISHITLPISMGYDFRAGKRWALQPRLGFEGAYTAATKLEDIAILNGNEAIPRPTGTRPLKPLSLHGTGALQLHYRVTPGIEIYGGPSYRRMLTNGASTPETLYNQPPYYKLRTSGTTFDAGVMFRLNSSKGAHAPVMPGVPQE